MSLCHLDGRLPRRLLQESHREIDWHIVDREFNAYAGEMLEASDTLILTPILLGAGKAVFDGIT